MGGKKKVKPAKNEPVANSDDEWDDGGSKKPNKKQLEQQAKKEEQALKKKEREMLLAAEEASLPSKKGGKTKSHKSGGLDDALNQFGGKKKGHIDAEGIEDALSAMTLLKKNAVGDHEIDRHPERRFKAALADYTEMRLPEIKKENPGLRKQQMEQLIYKEFEKHPSNPFNKETVVGYNASQQDVSNVKKSIKDKRSSKFEK